MAQRTAQCTHCGGGYITSRSDSRFCSPRCRYRARKNLSPQRACVDCGIDISDRMGNARYCAPCATKRAASREANRPAPEACRTCGATVVKRHSRYCSAACRKVGRAANRRSTIRLCQGCGEEFTSLSNRGKYCTNKCGQVFRIHGISPKRAGRTCVTCAAPLSAELSLATKYCGEDCRPTNRPAGRTATLPRKLRIRDVDCGYCGQTFTTDKTLQIYCSEWCSDNGCQRRRGNENSYAKRLGRSCLRCGTEIPIKARSGKKFCTESCQVCFNQELRRARKRGLPVERISRADVFERDNYVCHICELPIGDRPVLDHLIPLALPDSPGHVWENVAAAHAYCNSSKNARVTEADYRMYVELSLGGLIGA